MLQFEPTWRFTSPGAAPRGVVNAFYTFIERVAAQGNVWQNVERFKACFGAAGRSSSVSWAWSDLNDAMFRASDNAPLFIEAFYDACAERRDMGLAVPDLGLINRMPAEEDAGYEIRPPHLIATKAYAPIEVPRTLSLAEQARPLIEESLTASERLMNEGQGAAQCRRRCGCWRRS